MHFKRLLCLIFICIALLSCTLAVSGEGGEALATLAVLPGERGVTVLYVGAEPLSLVALETATGRGDGAARGLLSMVDARTTEVAAHFELHPTAVLPAPLTVQVKPSFPLDEGESVTVYIGEGDSVRTERCTVTDGGVELTLSGYAQILIASPMKTPHGMGHISWIILLGVFVLIAVGVVVLMEVRARRAAETEQEKGEGTAQVRGTDKA